MGRKVTPEEFWELMKRFPDGAVRAISNQQDLDFYGIVKSPTHQLDVNLFVDPYKDFEFTVKSVEESDSQLVLTTSGDTWAFRPIPEEDRKPFVAGMRKAGIDA